MHKQTPYRIRLHIISPVHIGCDDVYEPTGFVVDKAQKKLISLDPVDFVRSLNAADRTRFLELCDKGTLESIVEIYKFMWNRQEVPDGHSVDVSKGFIDTYERVATRLKPQDAKQELNKFLVARTSYLPADNAPYIPGSALKGALRTGWLNHLNRGQRRDGRDLEVNLLGGRFAEDPFSLVKVGDLLPVGMPATKICFAVNKKKRPSPHEPRGPQQIMEVIRHDCGAVFEGIITIHTPQAGSPITRPIKGSADFFEQASAFFSKEMSEEERALQAINLPVAIGSKMKSAFGDRYLKTVFPMRIGRHSGAECVTVEGVRNIKILGKRVNGRQEYTFGPNSTTFWLAGDAHKATSNLLPFGWVALELLEPDPAAPLWPQRTITNREKSALTVVSPPAHTPPPPPEQVLWDNAVLVWSPGNQVLTATCDGKKAEVKLAAETSLVPEVLHKKLFVKKDVVKARVTVEKQGNAWLIVEVAL